MQKKISWGCLALIFSLLAGCGGDGAQDSSGSASGESKPPQTSNPQPPTIPNQPAPGENNPPQPPNSQPPTIPNEPPLTVEVYQDQPDVANCVAGTLSEATKQNILKRLNLIRALHGLAAVRYDYQHDDEVMQAALIMSANKKLSHEPPNNWKCYSPVGYSGAGVSNLYIQAGTKLENNQISVLQNDLTAWLIDLDVLSSGHRRWLLSPFLTQVAYGSVAGKIDGQSVRSSALRVSYSEPTQGSAAQELIAYPMGEYPKQYFNKQGAFLSVALLVDKANLLVNTRVDFAQARISIKARGGQAMTVTEISSNNQRIGLPNHLQFKVAQLQENVIYDVHLENVLVNKIPRSYDYWFKLQ